MSSPRITWHHSIAGYTAHIYKILENPAHEAYHMGVPDVQGKSRDELVWECYRRLGYKAPSAEKGRE